MNKIFSLILSLFLFSSLSSFALERDAFIEDLLNSKEVSTPEQHLEYDYSSVEKIPILLQIVEPITTKNDAIYDGQVIDFIIREDVKYNHKVIVSKGTKATAVVQTHQSRGMNGLPGIILLDDFKIPNIPEAKLKDVYIHRGQDRSYIVYPIKWALTLIPFAGYVTNAILGGHANIKKRSKVKIYYYPNWQ